MDFRFLKACGSGRLVLGSKPMKSSQFMQTQFLCHKMSQNSTVFSMFLNVEIVQYMLDLGADMRQYNHLASVSSKGHLDVLKLLIRYGANVNENIYNCGTPLQNAVKKKHLKIVSELLKSGANPNLQYRDGNTSIHVAATLPDSMKVLLNEGGYIDLNIRNKHGQTALEIALEKGCKDIAKMILLYMKSI